MKIIAYLTVLLSIAAKGQQFWIDEQEKTSSICALEDMMNKCHANADFDHDGATISLYKLSTCGIDGQVTSKTFAMDCGNGKSKADGNKFYQSQTQEPGFDDHHPCCEKISYQSKYDADTTGEGVARHCAREEEVIKVTKAVLGANCDAKLRKDLLLDNDNPISKACDGKHGCLVMRPYGKDYDDVCDEADFDFEFTCYYDFDNKNNPSLTPSDQVKRRLQHHGGLNNGGFNNNNGGFNNNNGGFNNNNNGGNSAVSTLYTVNVNCNAYPGTTIHTTTTCSNGARSACDNQSNCYYLITSQNSPECGNFGYYNYQCY